jgi:hypothetical protein
VDDDEGTAESELTPLPEKKDYYTLAQEQRRGNLKSISEVSAGLEYSHLMDSQYD